MLSPSRIPLTLLRQDRKTTFVEKSFDLQASGLKSGVGIRRGVSLAATSRFATPDAMFFHAHLARSFIQSLRVKGDDDFVDRLNYYYTPIMLAIACLVISAKQYGGSPIECWINPHSRESMEEYIESFCWIQNTYWVPMYEHIPDSHEAREEQQIGYYQWVPFILIAEALMVCFAITTLSTSKLAFSDRPVQFSLPCIIWRLLNWQSGLNIQNVITAACDARALIDENERERVLQSVSQSFVDILDLMNPDIRPHPSASWLGKFKFHRLMSGYYISCLYLAIKFLYTANIVIQFTLLNAALKTGDGYFLFGFQVLADLLSGKPWTKSGHFPRVTLCDFEVRYLANLNRYTVQCALLINIINEKVFAFFWMWYLLLVVVTTCSALFWLTNCILGTERVDYLLKLMQIASSSDRKRRRKLVTIDGELAADVTADFAERVSTSNGLSQGREVFRLPDPCHLEQFVHEFLKSDGVFILRLMANHAGELVVVTVVRHLWREYCERNWQEIEDFEAAVIPNRVQMGSATHRMSNRVPGNRSNLFGFRLDPSSKKSRNSIKFAQVSNRSCAGIPHLTDSLISEDKVLL